jgi:hypothetical protein
MVHSDMNSAQTDQDMIADRAGRIVTHSALPAWKLLEMTPRRFAPSVLRS